MHTARCGRRASCVANLDTCDCDAKWGGAGRVWRVVCGCVLDSGTPDGARDSSGRGTRHTTARRGRRPNILRVRGAGPRSGVAGPSRFAERVLHSNMINIRLYLRSSPTLT